MNRSSNWKKLLILPIVLALASCGSSKPPLENSMKLWSPDLLRLKAGSKVQTLDGEYTAQTDETWHNHATYMDRVREALK